MKNEIRNIFDRIQADDALKRKTAEFLFTEIEKRSQRHKFHNMRFATMLASFVFIVLVGGFSYNLYFTPRAYVDLDVNPSIELTLNRFDRVIDVAPYNDDGKVILLDVDVQNKTYSEAVKTLLDTIIKDSYLKQDGLVSMTVQTGNNELEKALLNGLKATVSATLQSHHSAAESDIFAVSKEVKECADGYNLSPAKYIAITELKSVDPTATFEECADHSINEIRQLMKEHEEGNHENGADQHEDSQNSNSQSSIANDNTSPKIEDHNENCEEDSKENH